MLWHTLSWTSGYKFRIALEVEYEVVLFLPYKQVRKIGVECMAFIFVLLNFRKEMVWLSYCDVSVIFDIDKTHMVERPGFLYKHLLRVSNWEIVGSMNGC